MKFSDVIEALQKGGIATRFSTPAFYGKWIVKQIPQTVSADMVPKMTSLPDIIKPRISTIGLEDEAKGCIGFHDQVLIVTLRDDARVTATSYTPSWEDIFADDWSVQVPADEEEHPVESIDTGHGSATAGKTAMPFEKQFLFGPRWNAEYHGVFIPMINKIVTSTDLSKAADWETARRLAKEAGGELMSRKDVDIIDYYLEDINRILEEHGGEPLTGLHWTSLEYSSTYAWYVHFSSGLVTVNGKYIAVAVRAVVAL